MAMIGSLGIQNTTNKTLSIYQGPKHKTFRCFLGPKSTGGFMVNDPYGRTFFRAVPKEGGSPIDLVVPASPVRTRLIWTI